MITCKSAEQVRHKTCIEPRSISHSFMRTSVSSSKQTEVADGATRREEIIKANLHWQ